jgi:hypothetical protein
VSTPTSRVHSSGEAVCRGEHPSRRTRPEENRGAHPSDYLLDVATDAQIRQEIAAQVLRDERTANAVVRVVRTPRRTGDRLTITLELHTVAGAVYPMTLEIDSATAVRLIEQAA